MIACRAFSARGPNSRAAGTTRSVSWEIGACQNGRKPPAVNRTPNARPSPDSALEDIVQAQAELFRKYQGFADAIEPPRNATAFERALALSGRDPSWKTAS